MDDILPPDIVAFAHRLADAAGDIARGRFRRPIEVAWKPGDSPVTEADRTIEARLREMIAAEYPAHGALGEEHPPERADADDAWVIDPIDGTRLFIAGIPLFATLIAFARRGAPVLGIIDQPITGERWVGGVGVPATLNGRAVVVRACPELGRALLCTSSPVYYRGADATAFARLRDAVGWTQYGADSYAVGLIAEGFVDLAVETGLGPHDYCASAAVIAAAGGVATDWEGAALGLGSDGRVLMAGDARAHAAALARLAG